MMNDDAQLYEIRIAGHLDERWQTWFEDLAITLSENETILHGQLRDQAELYGVLKRINNLGLTLISVKRQAPPQNP